MIITNTIYTQHCGDETTSDEIQRYASAVEAIIREHYSEAEVETEILDNVSGVGSGISSDDFEMDVDELDALAQNIWDRRLF